MDTNIKSVYSKYINSVNICKYTETYSKYKKCQSVMMLICIKQHLSRI